MTRPFMRLNSLNGRRRRGPGLRLLLAAILVLAAVVGGFVLFRIGSVPIVELGLTLPALGPSTPVKVRAEAPSRGLTRLEVRLRQDETSVILYESDFLPDPPWALWAPLRGPQTVELTIKKPVLPNPRGKEAVLEVTAVGAGTVLRSAPTSSVSRRLAIRLRPPRIALMSENVFVAQGGSEAVVYSVGPTAKRHGVRAGDHFFPGYPLPDGGTGDSFALFAIPFDLDTADEVAIEAEDEVGNVGSIPFIDRFKPRSFRKDTINVTDSFMEIVVPRILNKTPELEDRGGLLENYIAINNELRKLNGKTLIELARRTRTQFDWNQAFVKMPAKVVSTFADHRTYFYKGEKVDQQYHLGFDLADVRKAPVPAANAGVVVFADYLGIYGNTVVIDHGYGLQSLYAHLSRIEVQEGDEVERGARIGRTGATGLALGDHLHLTIMLHGLPVTPLEWWDRHWIQDRIALKLGDALGFEASGKGTHGRR